LADDFGGRANGQDAGGEGVGHDGVTPYDGVRPDGAAFQDGYAPAEPDAGLNGDGVRGIQPVLGGGIQNRVHVAGPDADLIGKHTVVANRDGRAFIGAEIAVFHGGASADRNLATRVFHFNFSTQLAVFGDTYAEIFADHDDFQIVQAATVADGDKVVPALDPDAGLRQQGAADMNLVAGSKYASAIAAEMAIPYSQQTGPHENGFESVFHHLRIHGSELLAWPRRHKESSRRRGCAQGGVLREENPIRNGFPQCGNYFSMVWKNRNKPFHTMEKSVGKQGGGDLAGGVDGA